MNYNSIGKLVATYGLQGELVLKHNLGKKTALKGLENIFIEEKKNEMLPYFIESCKIKSPEEVYIKLEGISSREAAQKITQREVWLEASDFQKYASKSAPISLLGYHMVDQGTDLGEILEVIEHPHQVLCRIDLNGKEALIPVHEETLQKLDKKKKQVHVILPDGLLDIYQ
jgi:16S rRNA processing protein RimM